MNLKSASLPYAAKFRVNQLVHKAIRKGEIVRQPCEKCSADYAYAHHEDYNKPMDIIWLCPKCHAKRHKEIRTELGIKIVGYGFMKRHIYPKQEAAK